MSQLRGRGGGGEQNGGGGRGSADSGHTHNRDSGGIRGGAGGGAGGGGHQGQEKQTAGRSKYYCDVCNVAIISYDLKNLYLNRTDWEKLDKLQSEETKSGDAADGGTQKINVDNLDLDDHTKYMFKWKHTKDNLPTYKTHRRVKIIKEGPMDKFFHSQGRKSLENEIHPDPEVSVQSVVEDETQKEVEVEEDTTEMEREGEQSVPEELSRVFHDSDNVSASATGDESEEETVAIEVEEEGDRRKKRRDEMVGVREIENITKLTISDADAEKIADLVVKKLEAKRIQREARIEAESKKIGEHWVTSDVMLVCRPCLKYSKSPEMPAKFKSGTKGTSGTIMRKNKKGKKRLQYDLNAMCSRHDKKGIHLWCVEKEKRVEEEKKSYDEKNEEAGLSVIRTAIKTLKRGGGSVDFMADLDLLSLTPGVVYAVKNNSNAAFFDIRDSTYEVVCEKIKDFFKDVRHISVSLDKVTVNHVSYTVVIAYFFYFGQLYCILVKLETLQVEDYDAEGTAQMVVRVLTSTLGYSRTKLANVLKHFSYDGVYANQDERVAGGGCLDMCNNVCSELGLDDGDITGMWDIGHNLQVLKVPYLKYRTFNVKLSQQKSFLY